MKNEITDEQLIEFLEEGSNAEIEERLSIDKDLKKRLEELKEMLLLMEASQELEVPPQIGQNIQSAIFQEQVKKNNNRPWMQIAAAIAFLVVGFGLGKYGQPDQSGELADLKNEIQSLREVTLTNTLQKHSASERILAVNRIEEKNTINSELIWTLVSTLNSDDSPNVRFAALQALGKFIDNSDVKAQLVKSLGSQSDVLIQISLISMLVEAEEKSAIAPLKEILDKEETLPEVKRQAEVALKVLT